MNALIQQENNLIGSKTEIENLSKKEEAKILLLSDSHGAKNLVREILIQNAPKVNALAFCGDGSYDIASLFEESFENEQIKNLLPPVIAMVRGNGDSPNCIVSFDTKTGIKDSDFHKLNVPGEILFSVAKKTIFMAHGNKQGVYYGSSYLKDFAQELGANIAFFGHTHIPYESNQNVYLINPGSVGSPRASSPYSFAIVEITQKSVNAIFYKTELKNEKVEFVPYFPENYSF